MASEEKRNLVVLQGCLQASSQTQHRYELSNRKKRLSVPSITVCEVRRRLGVVRDTSHGEQWACCVCGAQNTCARKTQARSGNAIVPVPPTQLLIVCCHRYLIESVDSSIKCSCRNLPINQQIKRVFLRRRQNLCLLLGKVRSDRSGRDRSRSDQPAIARQPPPVLGLLIISKSISID